MGKRRSMTKKTRFEVFKRDSFTCVYCGRKAPDVVLQVDHVHPVAKGGNDDLLNLVTACDSCNSGKSDRALDDSTVVGKRMSQATALQAKREQIEMIAEWQRGLADIENESLRQACDYFNRLVPGWFLSENGAASLRQHVAKDGLAIVMACIRQVSSLHVRLDEDGKATEESSRITCRVLLNTLKYREANERDPIGAQLRYIAGIARNRYRWCPVYHRRCIEELHTECGIPIETLRQMVLEARSWDEFEDSAKEKVGS